MEKGDWQTTLGYRHTFSHVHFTGTTENDFRDQLGTPILQKTNLEDIMVTYQATDRVSCQLTVPFLSASRRNNSQYATLHTSGLSDVSLGAQVWLFNPKTSRAKSYNVQLGLGVLAPTGKDREENRVITNFGGPQVLVTPDYSAQPGTGTWAMIMSFQAFKDVGNQTTLYGDGNYVMTQGGYKNFWSSHGGTPNGPPAPTPGLTQFDAIQDQYMFEIGAAHPAPKIKGLTLTLGVRDEGVPAANIIGNDLGFRRSGFSVNLNPGFIYTRGNHMLQASVGKAMFRDRTQSAAEKINGTHGDAGFANYVWLAAYTLRLPKRHPEEAANVAAPGSNDSTPAAKNAALTQFPSFNLKTLDGTKKTLQDYSNKVTLVAFFYPRCPYCNLELPFEQVMYDKYKDKGLSMVWINILPDEEKLIAPWLVTRRFDVPVLVGASEAAVERDFRVTGTPTNYLLGPNGEVIYSAAGYKPGDEKTLEAKITQVLGIGTNPSTGQ